MRHGESRRGGSAGGPARPPPGEGGEVASWQRWITGVPEGFSRGGGRDGLSEEDAVGIREVGGEANKCPKPCPAGHVKPKCHHVMF